LDSGEKATHIGFIRKSSVFIFLMFMGNIFELGFAGLTARLPGTGYETINALFNILYIIVAPLTGIQFVISKEVSSYNSLGEIGKARTFVRLTFRYVLFFSLAVVVLGLITSPIISSFLRMESVLPVVLLMVILVFYSPFPVFYGAIQGMKKFFILGIVQFSWGFFRFLLAVLVILVLSMGLYGLMCGVICAVIASSIFAWIPVRSLFKHQGVSIDKQEILKAYSLVFPIIATLFCVIVLKNTDIIFAKRFFDPESAKAYTCAARVGAGFFSLTGIIMVMFPHVSEERTQSRNPIVFLLKSFVVTIGLSMIGILIAWYAPEFVMRVITLNKYIPGAEPLIRVIGFAVLPVSLVYIMSNYLLAKHYSGFLPILIGGMFLQIFLINLIHQSPLRMLTGIGIANAVTCAVMLFYIIKEHRHYMKTSFVSEGQSRV